MKVIVIGLGAVGGALAYQLQKIKVACLAIGAGGPIGCDLIVEEDGIRHQLVLEPPSKGELEQAQLTFVCVKAYHLAGLADRSLGFVRRGTAVIPLVNGAIEEELKRIREIRPELIWRRGLTTLAVSRGAAGDLSIRSRNFAVTWGPIAGDRTEITPGEHGLLSADGGRNFLWRVDAENLARRKWLFNTVINTLCAAHMHDRNGLLLNNLAELSGVFTEAVRLGTRLWGEWSVREADLWQDLTELISDTSENQNSMVADLEAKRPTENSYLAGKACAYEDFPLLQDLSARIATRSRIDG